MSIIIERFLRYEQEIGDQLFLHQPMENGVRTWTWKEAGSEARKMTASLQSMGLEKGDRVAILSKNCAEWIMADLAIMMGGFVSVPLYFSISAPSIRMLLEHSGSKVVFVGKLDKFKEQEAGMLPEVPVIFFGAYGNQGTLTWENLVQRHAPVDEIHHFSDDELYTIMYTSGTTGKPKGVMHNAGALRATMLAAEIIPVKRYGKSFSYLPLSHIAERMAVEMISIYHGETMHFTHSLETFASDLAYVKPDTFLAVPRIWAKFREKVEEKLPPEKLKSLLRIPLVSYFVKKKIKKALGLDKASIMLSGAAPISIEMLEWYHNLGIDIYQAYGMTEDGLVCHINIPGHNKFGTVGKPMPGLERKIDENGEILVKSKALMIGYYREPALTAEMFTEDGFLHTGDKGEIDSEGYLWITGRIKDLFKTDKGKYISPSSIELRLTDDLNIEQACVVGMGIPQPIGLICLSEISHQQERGSINTTLEQLMKQINRQLEAHEKLEKLVIMPEPWTVENGLMTPTLKVKRNEIEKIHEGRYSEWFHHADKIVWL